MSQRFALRTVLLAALATCCMPAWPQSSLPGYLVSNSKHYRDSGVGNAQGRSGGASLTARALLGKDNMTTIEVTTGSMDSSATPPGAFSKVQFKPLLSNGNVLLTQNFTANTPNGYYEFTWPSLHRMEQVQLQGNITGIDNNRTDVVTVVETVKLRPDLAVQNLTFPSSAHVNLPVNISANVVEMNGDAGATANCVLAIDGSNADTAPAIWVDAAGSVSCKFAYTFTTTGAHTIQVTAANVVPADWDTSNNSASGTISISSPPTPLPYASAQFFSQAGGWPYAETYVFEIWQGTTMLESLTDYTSQAGTYEADSLDSWGGDCVGTYAFQFPVSISYTESMDGTQLYSITDPGIAGSPAISFADSLSICGSTAVSAVSASGVAFVNDHSLFAEWTTYYDVSNNPLYTEQYLNAQHDGGDVTYISTAFGCFYLASSNGNCNNPPIGYYYWNSTSSTQQYGTWINPGSTWTSNIAMQDASGKSFAGPTMSVPLSASTYNEQLPNTCYNFGPDPTGATYQQCHSYNYNYTVTQGAISKLW